VGDCSRKLNHAAPVQLPVYVLAVPMRPPDSSADPSLTSAQEGGTPRVPTGVRLLSAMGTRTNSVVYTAVDSHQRPVVVKHASSENIVGSGAGELALQVQHLRKAEAIRRKAGIDRFRYPAVEQYDGETAVLEYVGPETLAVLRRRDLCAYQSTLRAAVAGLLSSPDGLPAPPPGWAFPSDLMSSRLKRTAAVAHHLRRLDPAVAAHCERALDIVGRVAWTRLQAIAPPTLSPAWHGDFVADNIVPDPSGNPVFIDLRGSVVWAKGHPWWDPIFDLAAFAVFLSAVPTIEGGADEDPVDVGRRAHDAMLADIRELHAVVEDADMVEPLARRDAAWRTRLSVYCSVKLFGHVSIAAAYAHRRNAVAGLVACLGETTATVAL
jgi:hypothetical protein